MTNAKKPLKVSEERTIRTAVLTGILERDMDITEHEGKENNQQ